MDRAPRGAVQAVLPAHIRAGAHGEADALLQQGHPQGPARPANSVQGPGEKTRQTECAVQTLLADVYDKILLYNHHAVYNNNLYNNGMGNNDNDDWMGRADDKVRRAKIRGAK